MALEGNTDLKTVLDGLGQGVLIFSSDGRLVLDNLAARTVLGTDVNVLRSEGWRAATVLFNTKQTAPDETLDAVRVRVLESARPVRFQTYRSGEFLPCWMAAVQGEGGDVYTMITLDSPDWSAMSKLMEHFRGEMRDAIESTIGHVDLVGQTLAHPPKKETVEQISRRIGGFMRLISIHMQRVGRLLEMLERLEHIRTGDVRDLTKKQRKKIKLSDFFEDFAEGLDEIPLVDPETDAHDFRSRVTIDVQGKLSVSAPPTYLTRVLHDILRNAIMYSMKATPIRIRAHQQGANVQIDITDEGYGIREKERERVFEPFQRARQPQIISEFGYGLSLYLCKNEVESMNGRIWFESEEGVGTTFSLLLPAWVENVSSSSSADL
jgi:signal transduction histidine kinase